LKYNKFFWTVFFFAIFCGCAEKRFFKDAEVILSGLNLDQKVGQMLMVAVPGKKMNPGTEKIIKKYLPGGIIFFGYNLGNYNKVKNYIADLQSDSMQNSGIPVFMSIDQEGGRVRRIVSGVTEFPGNMAAGISPDEDDVFNWGRIAGIQLRQTGINMNLAPVLDVNNNPDNPVINTRSFGSDQKSVSKLGRSYIRGLQKSGCIAVGKHFPGHGDTNIDSHISLPVIHFDMERLKKVELVPFKEAISEGVECIMTAHISFPEILGNNDPATLSKFFLTDLLRKDMGFKGIVITDDMEMNAISGKKQMGESAVKSVLAGSDIILISSYGENTGIIYNAVKKAVKDGRISEQRIDDSVKRIIELKLRYGIMKADKGQISPGSYKLTDTDAEFLKEADKLNYRISRRGVSYYGRKVLPVPDENQLRMFISESRLFKKGIKKYSRTVFFNTPVDFFINSTAECSQNLKKIVFYHFVKSDIRTIKKMSDFCKKNRINLVLVTSGNPFPLFTHGIRDPVIISFSNTPESLKQLAGCINGDFKPVKYEMNNRGAAGD